MPEEDFGAVNVPDPGKDVLPHQQRRETRAAGGDARVSRVAVGPTLQGIGSEPREQRLVLFGIQQFAARRASKVGHCAGGHQTQSHLSHRHIRNLAALQRGDVAAAVQA